MFGILGWMVCFGFPEINKLNYDTSDAKFNICTYQI